MVKLTKTKINGEVSKEEVKSALQSTSEDQKRFADIWQSRFIRHLNEETRADLTMLPYVLRNLTSYTISEGGRSWKLSILIGDTPNMTIINAI